MGWRDALAKFAGKIVQQRAVSLDVDVGILRLRKQPRATFEIEFGIGLKTERKKAGVGGFAVEMFDDFLGALAEQRIAFLQTRLEPELRIGAE